MLGVELLIVEIECVMGGGVSTVGSDGNAEELGERERSSAQMDDVEKISSALLGDDRPVCCR